MSFDLTHLGLGIFVVLLVGAVAWFSRMSARAEEARERKAINRILYNQPWDTGKSSRSGNR